MIRIVNECFVSFAYTYNNVLFDFVLVFDLILRSVW